MKANAKLIFLFAFIMFFSCGRKNENQNIAPEETSLIEQDLTEALTTDTVKKKHEIKEQKENLEKIEKKYGEQWGFCECVVINDSIDKAVKSLADFETPEAEKLLERWEFVSNRCQAFLGMDSNKTPEDREKHAKKVKRCLGEAKG